MVNWGRISAVFVILTLTFLILQQFGFFNKSETTYWLSTSLINENENKIIIGLRNRGEKDDNLCVRVLTENENLTLEEIEVCDIRIRKKMASEETRFVNFKINESSFQEPIGDFNITIEIANRGGTAKSNYFFIEECNALNKRCNYKILK